MRHCAKVVPKFKTKARYFTPCLDFRLLHKVGWASTLIPQSPKQGNQSLYLNCDVAGFPQNILAFFLLAPK